MELATGLVRVRFHPGATPSSDQLRKAVTDGGFTTKSVDYRKRPAEPAPARQLRQEENS
ncbi:MAG: hypothetical protein ACE5GE_13145 [Phycisphaerae bacterium]